MDRISIIAVEDDADLLESICRFLSRLGMDVRGATTGEQLDALLADRPARIAVLDVNLPDETGFSLAARLRAVHPEMGIIMLTGRDRMGDRVLGLNLGADSYLVKPVHLAELQAVILSLARRLANAPAVPAAPPPAPPVRSAAGGWILDRAGWSLVPPDRPPVPLTSAEFRLLDALVAASGNAVPRDTIASALGRASLDPEDRSLDAILTRLRRKVEAAGATLPVRSVRAIGYAFTAAITVQPAELPPP